MQETSLVEFTEKEYEYLNKQRLARIATVSADHQPHVVPVVYEFDGRYFYFSGWTLRRTLKFRNIQHNKKVALVVDDLASVSPWSPRGIEVRGFADAVVRDGYVYVKITPRRKRSWGLEEEDDGA